MITKNYLMDIKPTKTAIQPDNKMDSMSIKLDQRLLVNVISSKTNLQSLLLQITPSGKTMHVQSNHPINIQSGQALQLLVTQVTPTAEFKVLNSKLILKDSTLLNLSPLILKQLQLPPETGLTPLHKQSLKTLAGQFILAKIIAITDNKIQLRPQLSSPLAMSTLHHKPPFIFLSLDRLNSSTPPSTPHNFKIGQLLQLEVHITGNRVEYKMPAPMQKAHINQPVFSAKVLTVTEHKIQLSLNSSNSGNTSYRQALPSPSVMLNISKHQIIHADTEIKKGQDIHLQVIQDQSPAIFKLLNKQQFQELKIQHIFKQILPIQESPTAFLRQLQSISTSLVNNRSISKTLKRLAREIIDSLPTSKSIANPKQLKQSLSQSGLFMESNLANIAHMQVPMLAQDFKNRLLKFQRALRQEIHLKTTHKTDYHELEQLQELQKKTENSLARTLINQLNSLPKEETSKQTWVFDLPFLHQQLADSARLKINHKQQTRSTEQAQENWSVTITLTPPDIGTIHCKLTYFEKTLNTVFWSEQPLTVRQIEQHLGRLKEQFKQAGINSGHLSAHKGKPDKAPQHTMSNQGWIDHHV